MQQGISLDPLLAAISDLLEEHQELIEQVRVDLQRGLKRPEMGGNGLTPPQVLRALVLTQLSQLRTFFGFFALIFVVKPCVFIVAL
jgi:hypothetical protein